MNIVINGVCGQMGKTVLEIAKQENRIEKIYGVDIKTENLGIEVLHNFQDISSKIDVIIDFSSPQSLQNMLSYAVQKKTALVLATTGYSREQLQQIDDAAKKIAIFKTANFSIGVNLLEFLVEKAAAFLKDKFDVEIIEKHHNLKKDSPSGTALMLANSVQNGLNTNTQYIYGRKGNTHAREKNEIGIHAVRGGTIVGEHDVIFSGEDEIITLSHSARSKKIFAIGAVQAALFVHCKQSGYYSMHDLLSNTLNL